MFIIGLYSTINIRVLISQYTFVLKQMFECAKLKLTGTFRRREGLSVNLPYTSGLYTMALT